MDFTRGFAYCYSLKGQVTKGTALHGKRRSSEAARTMVRDGFGSPLDRIQEALSKLVSSADRG